MPAPDMMNLKRKVDDTLVVQVFDKTPIQLSEAKALDVSKSKSLSGEHYIASRMSRAQTNMADGRVQPKRVCFEIKYNSTSPEPTMKRRRFQRRNSKTAAMLFSSIATIVSPELNAIEREDIEREKETSKDSCDVAIKIAEDLVRHLRLRRHSLGNACA